MAKINRLPNAQFFRLGEALDQAVGCVLDGIEGLRVTAVDQRKEGSGSNGPYSIQRLHVQDGRDKASVQVWNFPDLSNFNGSIINLESTLGRDNNPHGVSIDEYQGEIRIKLSESGLIDNVEDTKTSPENQWQNQEAHDGLGSGQNTQRGGNRGGQQRGNGGGRQQAPQQRQQPQQRPNGGGQRQQTQTRGPADRHEKKQVFGATVGMAVNQACAIIREWRDAGGNPLPEEYYSSRQFSKDLHQVSSDILRVAEILERGDFAPSATQRERAAKKSENQEDVQQPDDRQRQQRAQQQQDENFDEGPGPFQAGMSDDDIPF